MKSLYREEVGYVLDILRIGRAERLNANEGQTDPTISALDFLIAKIGSHKGEYVRIPTLPPEILSGLDKEYITELLYRDSSGGSFYQITTEHIWDSDIFGPNES